MIYLNNFTGILRIQKSMEELVTAGSRPPQPVRASGQLPMRRIRPQVYSYGGRQAQHITGRSIRGYYLEICTS